jgi:hypothetical protein
MKELIFYIFHWSRTLEQSKIASLTDAFFMPNSLCIRGVQRFPDRSKLAYFQPSWPPVQNLRVTPKIPISASRRFCVHII